MEAASDLEMLIGSGENSSSCLSPTSEPQPSAAAFVPAPSSSPQTMTPVHYGDIIYLNYRDDDNTSGYLSVTPSFHRVGLQPPPVSSVSSSEGNRVPLELSSFDDCLFQVVPFLSYDSKAASSKLSRSKSFSVDERALIEMRMAVERTKNEKQIAEMSTLRGSCIYGQILQLKHCKSGMYLSTSPFTAEIQKDCLELALSQGSISCHFKCLPRYKVRNEGSEILYDDQVQFFSVTERGYGIHVSKGLPYDSAENYPRQIECNLSTGPSSMKIMKYSRPTPGDDSLRHGEDIVRLFHPETESFLQASCDMVKGEGMTRPFYRKISHESGEEKVEYRSSQGRAEDGDEATADSKPSCSGVGGSVLDDVGVGSNGGLATATKESNMSGKQLFIIEEGSTRMRSSSIQWECGVRLRHVATGRYLGVDLSSTFSSSVESDVMTDFSPTIGLSVASEVSYKCRMYEPNQDEEKTVFQLCPTDKQGETIPSKQVSLRLEYIHPGTRERLHMRTRTKSKWLNSSSPYPRSLDIFFSSLPEENEALLLIPFSRDDLKSRVSQMLSMLPYLRWFVDRATTDIKLLRNNDIKKAGATISRLVNLLAMYNDEKNDQHPNTTNEQSSGRSREGDGYRSLNSSADLSSSSLTVNWSSFSYPHQITLLDSSLTAACDVLTQNFARDFKFMDLIFTLATLALRYSLPTSYSPTEREWTSPSFSKIANLVKLSFRAVQRLFHENRKSENYFARQKNWINPGVVDSISDPIGAAVLFEALISNNATLLRRHVDGEIFSCFQRLILSRGPESRFLKFFTACCSCQGEGIRSNQETIFNMVWRDQGARSSMLLGMEEVVTGVDAVGGSSREVTKVTENYLGKETLEGNGGRFKRVKVSWEGMEKMSEELLPFTLGRKKSCFIEELCWVLDPAKLYPLLFGGKSWEDERRDQGFKDRAEEVKGSPSSVHSLTFKTPGHHASDSELTENEYTKRFYNQLSLAKYFASQITFLSSLCIGRSYNCILSLSQSIPYEMIVSCLNNRRLPDEVRAPFVTLLRRLWIDRYPHGSYCGRPVLPDLVWVQSDLKKRSISGKGRGEEGALPCFKVGADSDARNRSEDFYAITNHFKFYLIRSRLEEFMEEIGGVQVIGNTHQNELVMAFLDVLNDLLSFGFFATTEKIVKVCGHITRLLDGRTDRLSEKAIVKGRSDFNGSTSNGNEGVQQSPSSAKVVPVIVAEDPTNRNQTNEPATELIARSMHDLEERQSVGASRWPLSNDKLIVMKSKISIFKCLFKVADIRAQYRLSQLLYVLAENGKKGQTVLTASGGLSLEFFRALEDLFEGADGKALDIGEMMEGNIDSVCMDLMMYDSDELFENALTFMRRRFGQRRKLINCLSDVLVLRTNSIPVFVTLENLDSKIQDLRYWIRSYDVWGVQKSPENGIDVSIYEKIIKVFDMLDAFIFSVDDNVASMKYNRDKLPSEVASLRPPNKKFQLLLRNMGLFRTVLIFGLQIDFNLMAKLSAGSWALESVVKQSRDLLFEVCKRTIFCLSGFVAKNLDNQEIVFKELGLLRGKMGVGLNVWDVIISLFEGNQGLCESCPASLFTDFARMLQINHNKYSLRELDFFFNVIEPRKNFQTIRTNQNKTITSLLDDRELESVLIFHLSKDERRDILLSSEHDKEINERKKKFHVKLMHLFALSSKDKNSFAAAKLQAKVPIRQILRCLINETPNHDEFESDLDVRASLLHFLCYVYIDTPLLEQKLGSSVDMWRALVSVSKEMAMIVNDSLFADERMNEESWNIIGSRQQFFDQGAKFISAFFKLLFNEDDMNSGLDKYFDLIVDELRKIDINTVFEKCTAVTVDNIRSAMKNSIGEIGEDIIRTVTRTDIVEEVETKSTENVDLVFDIVFRKIDRDGNGFLTSKEVQEAIMEVNGELSKGQVKSILKRYDTDNDSRISKVEFTHMLHDAQALKSNVNWLTNVEVLDTSPETMDMMKNDLDGFLREKLCPVLGNSQKLNSSLSKRDGEFLDILKNVDSLSDPNETNYIAALRGNNERKGTKQEEQDTTAQQFLNFMNGKLMLYVVLMFVGFAIILLIAQLVTEGHSLVIEIVDYFITAFFAIEVTSKLGAFALIHGEIDTFLLDPLNAIDVTVVVVDVLFIYSQLRSGGNRSGGGVKALRTARIMRLLRLIRVSHILKKNRQKEMTTEEAIADKRSVKITFDNLLSRMIRYMDRNILDGGKEEVLVIIMEVIVLHLNRLHDSIQNIDDDSLLLAMDGDLNASDLQGEREKEFMAAQANLDELGLTRVAVKAISHVENEKVLQKALLVVQSLMRDGNSSVQLNINEILTTEETDGAFFFKVRSLIHEAGEKLKEYRKVRKLNEERSETLVGGVIQVVGLFNTLQQMCEGHQKVTQNLLREQTQNVRSADIISETLDYLSLIAKSLSRIRKWNDLEARCALAAIEFLTESAQGPCAINQEVIATRAKAIDGCLSILSAKMKNVDDYMLKSKLTRSVSVLLSSCLEGRASNDLASSLFDQVPIGLINDRIAIVGRKMQLMQNHSVKFKATMMEIMNAEARSLLTLRHIFLHLRGKEEQEGSDAGGVNMRSLGMLSVEVFWNGRCTKVYFTASPETVALNEASKERFISIADISNQEARVKSLIGAVDDLDDEVKYQYKLSQFPMYRWLSYYIVSIKKLTFGLVLLLNINVMLSTFDQFNPEESVAGSETFDLGTSSGITIFLGVIVMFLYMIITAFMVVSFVPLEWRRSLRSLNEEMLNDEEVSTTTMGMLKKKVPGGALKSWLMGLLFYSAFSYIHATTKNGYESGEYVDLGVNVFVILLPFALRAQLKLPKSPILRRYCALMDALMHPSVRNHMIMVIFTWVGLWRSYFFTLTLLDVLTMSGTLESVVKSVVQPINQLVQTLFLFLVVICCYTSFAYYLFGANEGFAGEENPFELYDANGTLTGEYMIQQDDDDAKEPGCQTLLECFTETFYLGIRTGDMAEVLEDPSETNYTSRVFFDLSFFLILGVLLFDMVTGIILDTFGSLREEVAEREGILKNCSFISGLTRDYLEEMGAGLNFDKINKVDQNIWNYFFFIMYIKDMEDCEMNGHEAFVKGCIKERDTSWIPSHTCCSIEDLGLKGGTDEMKAEEDMERWKEGIEEKLNTIKALLMTSQVVS